MSPKLSFRPRFSPSWPRLFVVLGVFYALNNGALAAQAAAAPDDKAVQKTLKTLISAVRYGKDDMAAKQLAFNAMAQDLLGATWAKASPAEQKEIVSGLETLLRKVSFPKGREIFQYLDAVLYDPVVVEGGKVKCKSTVVIHRDLKKTELPITWVLVQESGQWKVVDTVSMGDSTAASIREDQVDPLLKEGGVPSLMAALRKKVAEAKKQ